MFENFCRFHYFSKLVKNYSQFFFWAIKDSQTSELGQASDLWLGRTISKSILISDEFWTLNKIKILLRFFNPNKSAEISAQILRNIFTWFIEIHDLLINLLAKRKNFKNSSDFFTDVQKPVEIMNFFWKYLENSEEISFFFSF